MFFALLSQMCLKKFNRAKDRRYKKAAALLFVIAMIIPALVSGFRSHQVGTDTSGTYKEIYESQLSHPFTGIRDEGYAVINNFATMLFGSYTGVLLLTSFIFCGAVYFSIYRQSKNPLLSVFLFYVMNVFFISMNMVRESLAISVFILSMPLLKERKTIKYMLLNIVGFTIHSSAIVYVPLYFIYRYFRLNKRNVALLLIAIAVFWTALVKNIISILSSSSYFQKYFAWYFSSSYNTGDFNVISFLVQLALLLFIVLACRPAKRSNDSEWIADYKLATIMSGASLLLIALSSNIPLMQRTSWLFSFPMIILVPNLLDKMKNNGRKYLLYRNGILVCYTIYSFLTIFILHYHEVVPYSSIIGGMQ